MVATLKISNLSNFLQSKPTLTTFDSSHLSQNVTSESKTEAEDIVGSTDSVTGKLIMDMTKKSGTGAFQVNLKGLRLLISMKGEEMRGEKCLHVAKFPAANLFFEYLDRQGLESL
jgi:hypothetical protein